MTEPTGAEVTEIERLRRLLAHLVWVIEDKAPGEMEKCELCRTAKGASREP